MKHMAIILSYVSKIWSMYSVWDSSEETYAGMTLDALAQIRV